MDKSHLRKEARFQRDRLSPDRSSAQAAAKLFLAHISFSAEAVVAGYWPVGREFDDRPILKAVLATGGKVCLPVADKEDRAMRFALWDGEEALVKSNFGTLAPASHIWIEPDIVIVPFLAFDPNGYRLGQGGGHYDATLADLRSRRKILAVGVGYAEQGVLFNLPREPHDQRLDMVITPEGAQDFRL